MSFIRKYTIPPGDEDEYDHHYTVYWPFFGGLFLLFMFFESPTYKWLLAIPLMYAGYYLFN